MNQIQVINENQGIEQVIEKEAHFDFMSIVNDLETESYTTLLNGPDHIFPEDSTTPSTSYSQIDICNSTLRPQTSESSEAEPQTSRFFKTQTSVDVSPTTRIFNNLTPNETRSILLLKEIETKLSVNEKILFNKCFEEKCDIGSGLYMAWFYLRSEIQKDTELRKHQIRNHCVSSSDTALARRKLFQVPQIHKKTKPKRKTLPLLLTSEAINKLEKQVEKKQELEKVRQLRKETRKILKQTLLKKIKKATKQKLDDRCMACGEMFIGGKKEPRWVACNICDGWYHVKCTN